MNYVKTKLKYLVGIATCAAIVSQLILPIVSVKATEPRFNFLSGDYELLRGANVSQNETVWKDPLTGTAGDEFRGLVYYHNGIVDSTAHNTKIKVSIPATTTNKTAKITATISADDANLVKDTVIDGVIIGPNGLTASFDKDVNLVYIPGSAKWFPNATPLGGIPTVFPNGQTGDEIVNAGGVNIGDINGCWDYAGFVSFGFKAKKIIVGEPEIVKSKSAFNVTRNQVATVAGAGDVIEYTLTTKNTGTSADPAFIINDDIADVLEYSDIVPTANGGTLTSGTIQWPALNIGVNETVIKKFTVKVKNPLPNNPRNGYHYDDAMYNIYGNSILIIVVRPQLFPGLHIEKLVRDVTTGEATFVKANQAFAGDVLEYRINYSNTGQGIADGVKFTDILPTNVTYIAGSTQISRNGSAEQTMIDGIMGNGVTLDNIVSGETGYIKVRATIAKTVAKNEVLTNTASLTDEGVKISDTANTTIVAKAVPATPTLPVTGSATGASFIITFLAGLGITFLRYRKLYDPSTGLIIADLLR